MAHESLMYNPDAAKTKDVYENLRHCLDFFHLVYRRLSVASPFTCAYTRPQSLDLDKNMHIFVRRVRVMMKRV